MIRADIDDEVARNARASTWQSRPVFNVAAAEGSE